MGFDRGIWCARRCGAGGGGSPDGFGFVPHEDALIVADAIRALETSARFEDRIEATALFGDLAAIAGDAIESIMKASFDPRSIVISKDMAHPQE